MMEDVEPIPITSGANLGRTCSNLRPPAVVTEFMSQGSVKSALARKSEVVVGNMHRVVVAMDAAKVRPCPAPCQRTHFPPPMAFPVLAVSAHQRLCSSEITMILCELCSLSDGEWC